MVPDDLNPSGWVGALSLVFILVVGGLAVVGLWTAVVWVVHALVWGWGA